MKKFDRETMTLMFKNNQKNKVILILVIVIVALVAVGIIAGVIVKKIKDSNTFIPEIDDIDIIGSEQEAQVEEVTTNIADIVGVSELHTLKYDYMSICRYYGSNNQADPVCYIAYEGTVVLGVDVSKITMEYGDEDEKVITVHMPAIEIQTCQINAGTLDYIFENDSYNTPGFAATAQQLCEDDLLQKVRNDQKMFELATKNTESEIHALTEPLIQQLYPGYTLEIKWKR